MQAVQASRQAASNSYKQHYVVQANRQAGKQAVYTCKQFKQLSSTGKHSRKQFTHASNSSSSSQQTGKQAMDICKHLSSTGKQIGKEAAWFTHASNSIS